MKLKREKQTLRGNFSKLLNKICETKSLISIQTLGSSIRSKERLKRNTEICKLEFNWTKSSGEKRSFIELGCLSINRKKISRSLYINTRRNQLPGKEKLSKLLHRNASLGTHSRNPPSFSRRYSFLELLICFQPIYVRLAKESYKKSLESSSRLLNKKKI